MKIEFKITKAMKEISTDNDGIVPWFSFFVVPICLTVLSFPFVGPLAIILGIFALVAQIIALGIMQENNFPDEVTLWFIWIPVILLAPITIPLDIFSSIRKGIWGWFSKKKANKALQKTWQHLLEKGLDNLKIEIDLFDHETDLSKNIAMLFEEIITDQLGRSIFKKPRNGVSEKIKIMRFEKIGDKICLIGSFVVTESQSRTDGSNNSFMQGRVFGITLSVSESTGISKVFHHTSRTLQEVHENEQLEDLWFDLLASSGISSNTASDPWKRRMQKCEIIQDEAPDGEVISETELN